MKSRLIAVNGVGLNLDRKIVTASGLPATTESAGIMRIATIDECIDGLDNNSAMTPLDVMQMLYEYELVKPPENKFTVGILPNRSRIKIQENGVWRDFIIIWQGARDETYRGFENGTTLIRERALAARRMHSPNMNDYANSEMAAWLNGTYLNTIQSGIRSQIKQVRIPFRPGNGTSTAINSGNNGLLTRVFLVSRGEVFGSGSTGPDRDGVSWVDFPATGVILNDSGNETGVWYRTPYNFPNIRYFVHVRAGSSSFVEATRTDFAPRPIFVIPDNTELLPVPDSTGAFFVQA